MLIQKHYDLVKQVGRFGRRSILLILSMSIIFTLNACTFSPVASPTATPTVEPLVYFPKQEPVVGEKVVSSILLIGELQVVDKSLRVTSKASNTSYILIWPPDYQLDIASEPYQVLDGDGAVAARVGDEVFVGGREMPGHRSGFSESMRANIPETYTGSYWLVSKVYDLQPSTALQADPLVYFPKREPVEGGRAVHTALLIGELIVVDKYLYIHYRLSNTDFLPIWPFDYAIDTSSEPYQVLNGDGVVVARVGDEVTVGGGEMKGSHLQLSEEILANVPEEYSGIYWSVSEVVLPRTEPMLEPDSLVFFPKHEAAEDAFTSLMTGNLVVVDECLRLNTGFRASYLLIWPDGYVVDTSSEPYQVLDGAGDVVAYVGDKIRVSGGTLDLGREELPASIRASIPRKCQGSYWFVSDVLDSQGDSE